MKAAVVTSFHSPLEIQELSIPEPGPGQLLGIGIVAKEGCRRRWTGSGQSGRRRLVGVGLRTLPGLHRAGKTCADRKLDQVSNSIADVLSGHVAARVVFQL